MQEINTSADFGEKHIVEVFYKDGGRTLHGPFDTFREGVEWGEARCELDYEDSQDFLVLCLNLTERPSLLRRLAKKTRAVMRRS